MFLLIVRKYSYIVISIKGNDPYELFNNTKIKTSTENFLYSSILNNFYSLMGIGRPDQNIVIRINPAQKDFIFNENNCQLFYNNKFINKNKLSPNNVTINVNISQIGYIRNHSRSFNKSKDIKLDYNYYDSNFFSAKERLKLDDYRNILNKINFKNNGIIYPYSQNNLVKFSFVYEEILD